MAVRDHHGEALVGDPLGTEVDRRMLLGSSLVLLAPDEGGLAQLASSQSAPLMRSGRPNARAKPASSSSEAARCSPSWAQRPLVCRSRTPSTRLSSGSGTCSAPTASPYLREEGRRSQSPRARGSKGRTSPSLGPTRDRARLAPSRGRGRGGRRLDDERLGPARAQVTESGIDSALALPLVVGDEPTACSPSIHVSRGR